MTFIQGRVPRMVAGAALLAVVAIVVAGAAWWFFVREDAQLATSPLAISTPTPAPSDTEVPPTSTTADAATAATSADDPDTPTSAPTAEPTLGPHIADGEVFTIVATHPLVEGSTEASYFAPEKLARLSLPSTAQGTTTDVEGQFFVNDEGIHPDHESSFTIGLTTLRSNESRRDSRVQSALQTSSFPDATFVATALSGYPAEFPANVEVAMQLTGMLTVHGVEAEVTWDVIATRSGDVLTALATLETRYDAWNVPVLNIGGFVTVEEQFTLQILIIAVAS